MIGLGFPGGSIAMALTCWVVLTVCEGSGWAGTVASVAVGSRAVGVRNAKKVLSAGLGH